MYTIEITDFMDPLAITHKTLGKAYLSGEAPAESAKDIAAANNAVNMIVVEKTMNNMRAAASNVITFNQAKMDEVIEKAEKIGEIAKGISTANKENSKALKVHQDFTRIVKAYNKKYSPKYGKSPNSYQGDLIIVGMNFMLVEYTGIIAEAIIMIGNGSYDTIDDYITKNGKYTDTMNMISDRVGKVEKELFKIGDEIYKEAIGIDSLHPITSAMLDYNNISLESESAASIFRVFKALLFKPLYILLSPIRYIIYMFMLAGFTIADRLNQIAETIAVYDESSNTSTTHREQKMNALEKTAARARMDRAETDAKVYKKTETEKDSLTKDINNTASSQTLTAIF